MSFQFDEVIDRRGTDSMKWDMTKQRFGGDNLLPLWVADMDFRAPQEILDALHKKVEHGIFGYPAHSDRVDHAVVNWLKRRYDWEIQKDSIIYTAGIVPTISYIIQAFTEPEDEVIIQTPVYYPFYDVVNKNNRKLVRNPLSFDGNTYTMDLEHLESVISDRTKMIVLCHPHNPVGRVWKRAELEALASICQKYDLLVVSDEIHADLLFKGQRHIPFASVNEDAAQRTFSCLAPSKTFNLAGIQTSYVVAENKKMRNILTQHLAASFANMTNSFAEVATEAAYNHGEVWLEGLMDYVEANYGYIKQFITEHMPKVRVLPSEGTYLIWIDCSQLPFTPQERKSWLINEVGLALNPGSIFGEEGNDFERMNIACPRATIQEALEKWKKSYDQLWKS
ncbi:MalY/PatB family protein [Halalkalibacter sp. APA_J-10(15)]|uniref:MalY/PatB family protein n=1 Tax=unclassified Halalkalibacter TaxID=2893063 RepID=UPI001FF2F0FA|nr:MalY/PatB family protein [Halalkalibacter sp. APA_J-10(15)]MCK0471242.1 pyridoxal phosphate-dependent aminotransferase [Halalkalibacter sp. APA_J-10(15)]